MLDLSVVAGISLPPHPQQGNALCPESEFEDKTFGHPAFTILALGGSMKNRMPVILLGLLCVIAIVWRVLNPPAPRPAGPNGQYPTWKSSVSLGSMVANAVSPSHNIWAGAWNETRNGKVRSSIWFIDFTADEARLYQLKSGESVRELSWTDDNTIAIMKDKGNKSVELIDAKTAKIAGCPTTAANCSGSDIICWPNGSKAPLMQASADGNMLSIGTLSQDGNAANIKFTPPGGTKFYNFAAISPDGKFFIFCLSDNKAKGGRSYYFADTDNGTVKRAFDLEELPGRIEGMWVSSAGALVACIVDNRAELVAYDAATGKLNPLSKGTGEEDLSNKWPNADKHIMFTTYDGGYDFKLATGKTKRLFDLTKLKTSQESFRRAIRDGRLYPIRDNYISVSQMAESIDIRVLKKDGTDEKELLPR